jgi:hypothetical protein
MSSLIEKEGKHYIKGKVVMLESKDQTHQVKEGDLFINDTRKYSWGNLEALRCERVTQHGHAWNGTGIRTDICHLYITSDNEIKDGDWFMSAFFSYPIHNIESLRNRPGGLGWTTEELNKDFKGHKIIATTDPSLGYTDHRVSPVPNFCSFPQPSESFIKAYIEAYNNGNVIEDILIEVHNNTDYNPSIFPDVRPKLKDNNIIIKKVKDSWTREEVHSLMMEAWIRGEVDRSMDFRVREKWIEENL